MQKKTCNKCGEEKEISQFYKQPRGKFGVRGDCISCHKEGKKIYHLAHPLIDSPYRKKYYQEHTEHLYDCSQDYKKDHPWIVRWCNIQQMCENPKNRSYQYYGANNIQCLVTPEELKSLWFEDKADTFIRAKLIRLDKSGDFVIGNLKFIEIKGIGIKRRKNS